MSIQPWTVRHYEWCVSCSARIVNPGDRLCTLCSAHLRLHESELDDHFLEALEADHADDAP